MEIKPIINQNLIDKNKTCSPVQASQCAILEQNDCESSQSCLAAIGKAQVLIQNKTLNTPETLADIKNLLNKIYESRGVRVGFCRGDKYISLGTPFEQFPDMCKDEFRAACTRDNDGFLDKIFVLEKGGVKNRGKVSVYSSDGKLEKYFNEYEMDALHEYKYSPECFHKALRHRKFVGFPTQDEIQNWIKILDSLFESDSKCFKTDKKTIVYRALPDILTDEQISSLSKIDGVFKENSYSSTTTNFDVANRFQHLNPILEIELPPDTKYLDMDALFNIDRTHWKEDEFLLPRNAEFEVTGYDESNNIIKVKYLKNCDKSLFGKDKEVKDV